MTHPIGWSDNTCLLGGGYLAARRAPESADPSSLARTRSMVTWQQRPQTSKKLVGSLTTLTAFLLCAVPASWAQQKHSAEEKGAAALRSDFATSIEFWNQGEKPIKLFRLNEAGQRVLVRTLAAGERQVESTFLTHPWLLTDEQDNALGLYYPDADRRLVTYGTRSRRFASSEFGSASTSTRSFRVYLLDLTDVQRDLHITPEQVAKIQALRQALTSEAREIMSAARESQSIRQSLETLRQKFDQAADELLNDAQRKRLGQLVRQQSGAALLTNETLLTALQATPEQREKLRTLQTRYNESSRGRPRTGDERSGAAGDSRQALWVAVAEMLSEQQREVWREQVGEPFTGSFSQSRGGPGWMGGPGGGAVSLRRMAFGRHIVDLTYLSQIADIQTELKLTPEQVQEAKKSYEEVRRIPISRGDSSRGDSTQSDAYGARSAATSAALSKLLTAEQAARFRQIMLQALLADERSQRSFGIYVAAGYPGVAEELKLTDEQRQRLIDGAKTEAVLTPEQAAQFQRMTGAPFTGSLSVPGTDRGSGGGPPGGSGDSIAALRRLTFGRHVVDLTYLARLPDMQTELKLTPEQVQQVQKSYDETRRLPINSPSFPMSAEGYEARSAAISAALSKLLTAEQAARFRQLMLQALLAAERSSTGFGVYTAAGYPGVAEELKLTDEQRQRLIDGAKTEAVLTAEQAAQLQRLTGTPFTGSLTLPRR
ncbi:MAG: hypothetical protein U0935_06845 [Pirellulales bacterium]